MALNRNAAFAIVIMGLFALSHVSDAADKCGSNPLLPLVPCIKSVTGDKPSFPDSKCCKAVISANLDCLCKAFTSAKPPAGFKVNLDAALALPKKCKRSIPKNYKCKGVKF